MFSIEINVEFAYAHRLISSYSKECQTLHGHNGICHIKISREGLNSDMMVVDFKKIKKIVNKVIADKYDHTTILHKDDPLVEVIKPYCNSEKVIIFEYNPTAEFMAMLFQQELQHELDTEYGTDSLKVAEVDFEETKNNKATYIVS